jgi:V8-like Glu-specific endopeptidase
MGPAEEAQMANKLKDWTADELLAELKRRQRGEAAKAAGGARRIPAPSHGGRGRDLAMVPTPDLARAARDRQRVIYGVDNRKDLFQVTSSRVKKSAAGVVALVKASDLTQQADGGFVLATSSYQADYQLCGSEPFVSQPLGCFCSGFLVAPDVIATAGHCVKSAADLAGIRFVFGFRMNDADTARTTFPASDVYAGKGVIGRQLAADGTDWALVRLDRPVTGRAPVPVRTSGKVPGGARLFVIGHPCGLPQKYAPSAQVRDNSPAPFFVANLDTYGGNSGSPVFNATSYKVEGILVRGETDFVTNGTCYVSLVCPTTGCRGEDVTRATIWAGKIPKSIEAKGRATGSSAGRAKAGKSRARRA